MLIKLTKSEKEKAISWRINMLENKKGHWKAIIKMFGHKIFNNLREVKGYKFGKYYINIFGNYLVGDKFIKYNNLEELNKLKSLNKK